MATPFHNVAKYRHSCLGAFADARPLAGCAPDSEEVDYELPTAGFGQETEMSCWFAGYAMMYNWTQEKKGKKYDASHCRAKVKETLVKANFPFDDCLDEGITSKQARKAGEILNFTGIKGTTFKKAPWHSIMSVLENRGPMWCGWKNHVIILAGMTQSSNKVTIKYYDPFMEHDPSAADKCYSKLKIFQAGIRKHEYAVQFLEGDMSIDEA